MLTVLPPSTAEQAAARRPIAGYRGSSPVFDQALADVGEAYADVTGADHGQPAAAVAAGRVAATPDV